MGSLQDTLDRYRERIDFDGYKRVSHPNDCYPGNCSLTGFLQDGELQYQEQTGKYPQVDPDTPDWNPKGCGRQCTYTSATYGDERIEQPMKQIGERGSGEWEPISWEEAYEEIAEALVDAMEYNPQSIITEDTAGEGGRPYHGTKPFLSMIGQIGGITLDLISGSVPDNTTGVQMTLGKFIDGSSLDDWYNAELILIWHGNPAYSRNQHYHFITEARYSGTEVWSIAPDYHPSALLADKYTPIEPATDAALALGMCRVMIKEGLVDWEFVREQTDLPLLVRRDTDRFLREEDLETGGSHEVPYMWDTASDELFKAPRETLDLGDIEPALEGEYVVEIDGEEVVVEPVYERMTDVLEEYDLETVSEVTGMAPEVVDELARKVATKRTTIANTFNTCKIFHGDLIERSMMLLLALSGNWGREGSGIPRAWGIFGEMSSPQRVRTDPFIRNIVTEKSDRDLTAAEIEDRAQKLLARLSGTLAPVWTLYYRHGGLDEVWNDRSLDGAGIPRSISDYLEEVYENDIYQGIDYPSEEAEPKVGIFCANNVLRNRPSASTLRRELWPKMDLVVTVDYRWSATAHHSDIVLPAAFHHEKAGFQSMASSANRYWAFADKAIEPRHDSKVEGEMVAGITKKIEEIATDRGLDTYHVPQGLTPEKFNEITGIGETEMGELSSLPENLERTRGAERSYHDLYDRVIDSAFSPTGDVDEMSFDEIIEEQPERITNMCVENGVFEEGTTFEEIRERGFAKYEGTGESVFGLITATDVEEDETVVALDKHIKDHQVYPTVTGRAQFYIEHEWFQEANEQLPVHKEPPADHGGDRDEYPYYITSGHNMYSTHSITLTNEDSMNMHRGEPHLFISPAAAEEKGVEDGDYIRVFSEHDETEVQAKVSHLLSDDQVVFYHAWDPYLYPEEEGKGMKDLFPSIFKPLHLAVDYGHFEYRGGGFQPQPVLRHLCVDFEPA